MASVITVPGALSTYNTGNFQGTLFAAPNNHYDGEEGSPGWLNGALNFDESSAESDMAWLDGLIHDHIDDDADPLIVAGHSRGGQIIYKWLREMGPTSDIDPADILFISSGNPERKYNGASVVHVTGHKPVYPGPDEAPYGEGYGLPTTPTEYTVLDIARQYDEWADHANQTSDSTPARDVTTDADVHSSYSACPELGLNGYPTDWNEWSYFTEGNVTYLLFAYFPFADTPPQPAYSFLAQAFPGIKRQHDKQYGYNDLKVRGAIESAWQRPMGIQLPGTYSQT